VPSDRPARRDSDGPVRRAAAQLDVRAPTSSLSSDRRPPWRRWLFFKLLLRFIIIRGLYFFVCPERRAVGNKDYKFTDKPTHRSAPSQRFFKIWTTNPRASLVPRYRRVPPRQRSPLKRRSTRSRVFRDGQRHACCRRRLAHVRFPWTRPFVKKMSLYIIIYCNVVRVCVHSNFWDICIIINYYNYHYRSDCAELLKYNFKY